MNDAVARTLQHYIDVRFQQFASTSLRDLGAPSDAFCAMPDAFLDFLSRHTEAAAYLAGAQPRGTGRAAG